MMTNDPKDAEIARLREERDRFEAALGRACQVGGTTYLVERAEKAEAERDSALAQVAGLQDKVRFFEEFTREPEAALSRHNAQMRAEGYRIAAAEKEEK